MFDTIVGHLGHSYFFIDSLSERSRSSFSYYKIVGSIQKQGNLAKFVYWLNGQDDMLAIWTQPVQSYSKVPWVNVFVITFISGTSKKLTLKSCVRVFNPMDKCFWTSQGL